MVCYEIIENVHIELVLHHDSKKKSFLQKVQLVAMATASDKFNKNGPARARKFRFLAYFELL